MKLKQLLAQWLFQEINDVEVRAVKNDSRLIQPGDLFLAYPGAVTDSRQYLEQALNAGAVAVAYDPINFSAPRNFAKEIPLIPIEGLSEQLAKIAQLFYADPSASLNITGVTGTNGKTTVAYQLAQAHALLGQKSAYIGTIGQGDVEQLQPLVNTTPDALCLQGLLAQYRQLQIKNVCMEVSSHALSQKRVDGVAFRQAIFTNLSLDHLDYHHTMEAYAAAKAELFAKESLEWAIINLDDPYQQLMRQSVHPQVKQLTYGLNEHADVAAVRWHSDMQGSVIDVRSPWGAQQLKIKAIGQFNIANSLALFASLLASGYPPDQAAETLTRLKAAPGRMEIVTHSPDVVVDYAHTPDALEKALDTLNQVKKGKLWVVFGCGGDRDKSKRPIMGKGASLYADHIIITSDNPRSEDPQMIMDQIAQGIPSGLNVTQLVSRELAIQFALNEAAKEDTILVAGKGHESYQQIGSVRHPFSDQEVIRRLIR